MTPLRLAVPAVFFLALSMMGAAAYGEATVPGRPDTGSALPPACVAVGAKTTAECQALLHKAAPKAPTAAVHAVLPPAATAVPVISKPPILVAKPVPAALPASKPELTKTETLQAASNYPPPCQISGWLNR
jgi:hypothetical protein